MVSGISEFYDKVRNDNTMISFIGKMTPESLGSIIQNLEDHLENLQEGQLVRRKIFSILIECLQNLYHHGDSIKQEDPSSMCVIDNTDVNYTIRTGNYIKNEKIQGFKKHLDKINELTKEELKNYYIEVLNNGQKSAKDGAGLGMIEISRKTGDKVNFEFIPVNDSNYSLFTLNIKIAKQLKS